MQSERYHYVAKDLDELITSVNLAWENMPYTTLLKNFLTLQSCMIESLKVGGSNFYKIPHMGKDKLLRKGALPTSLHIDINLVHNTIQNVKDYHAATPDSAKVIDLPSLPNLVGEGPDFSDNSCSDNDIVWEEDSFQLV